MTTRLRSDKGSFVQSPLKAFDTDAAPVGEGRVNSVDVFPTQASELERTFCTIFLTAGPQSRRIQFDLFEPFPSLATLRSGSVVGLTSGAVLDLTVTATTFRCNSQGNSNLPNYSGGQNTGVGTNVERWEYMQQFTTLAAGASVISFVFHVNDGTWPTAIVPPFVASELISVVTP